MLVVGESIHESIANDLSIKSITHVSPQCCPILIQLYRSFEGSQNVKTYPEHGYRFSVSLLAPGIINKEDFVYKKT